MIPLQRSGDPYSLLRSEMDRLFDDFLGVFPVAGNRTPGANPLRSRARNFPACNVWENEESYFVEAECPGLSIEDLELTITGKQLTLGGKANESQREGDTYHRRERGTTRFSRLITLPSEVDAEKVEASLKNGVLCVRLPKAASAKPRKITVKT